MSKNHNIALNELIACEQCDQLQRRRALPRKGVACCQHCNSPLYTHDHNSLDRSLALTITALILFAIANSFPLLTMNLTGHSQDANLISASIALYEDGITLLAALVFLTSILAPLLELTGLLYVLTVLQWMPQWRPSHLRKVFRMVHYLSPWGMLEVFMLGILVAVVKLAVLATIIVDSGLYAFAALIFVLTTLSAAIDKPLIWKRLETDC